MKPSWLKPKPREMLMVRDDAGLASNRIIVSDQEHRSTLAGVAEIIAIGDRITEIAAQDPESEEYNPNLRYKVGMKIVLAGGIGTRVECGKTIVETLKPAGVLNVILKDPSGTSKKTEEDNPTRHMTGDEAHFPTEEDHQVMEIEEGDPRGLLR